MRKCSSGSSPLRPEEGKAQHKFRAATFFVAISACIFLLDCGGGTSSDPPVLIASVSGTQNPLVAQYTVTSGCTGEVMVEFGPDTSYGRSTAWYPITGSYSQLRILVAGMRASTSYHMRLQRQCRGSNTATPDATFTTGAPPTTTPFPALQVSRPSPSLESPGIELVDTIAASSNQMQAFFTDRDGNPIWYYDVGPGNYPFTFKLLTNGHILFNIVNPTANDSLLREVDLAGNTIREMNISTLQPKMQAAGFDFVPVGFHHDFLPLDNGHLIVLTDLTRPFDNLSGYPGTTQVIGDALIDLDADWNPVWSWNAFDYLDVNRHLFGLPDWTHANAVVYSPNDGNLILSMRHQSWILKIDYNNGAGTGNVLWRLGYQGDFALAQGADPTLWFAFQHYPSLISQSGPQSTLAIWDNGDFRPLDTSGTTCLIPGPPACYSRATVFQVDESAKVANLLWADAPGYFSVWGGSVSQLSNGNIEFDLNAPLMPPVPDAASEVQEVKQTSSPAVVWKMDLPLPMNAYRAYRVPSLYPGVTWQY